MNVFEYLTNHYSNYDEENRLLSKNGQVEFLTTVRYVDKYLKQGMKILEIGAATGRYSHHFAKQGFEVDAIELVQHNIDVFISNTEPNEKVTIQQGNAMDLSEFPDNTYDITLLLGPMYHLYTEEDKLTAISEALRVTKRGGIVCIAYCISDASIIEYGFKQRNMNMLIDRGLVDRKSFNTTSNPEEIFELVRKEDVDNLISHFDIERLHYVGTDMYTNYMRETVDSMDDETFGLYLDYHFSICERQDLVGVTNHSLDIVRKRKWRYKHENT